VTRASLGFATLLFVSVPAADAYSVLTHEAIIDSAWDTNIRPLLAKRFPQASDAELRQAHAYAYAGCIIQDMGYYPFGSKLFSDLTHYVRSGDFVLNLLKEARTLDEYSFALGAMAHYAADTQGHSIAVNRAVPIEYPKLERKFGPTVTYADDKTSHLRVEFGFDVVQVSRGNYAPPAYHDFIGFEVSEAALDRAFQDTYGLQLKDLFSDVDLSMNTYRRAVSSVIPSLTRAAWQTKKGELKKTQPTVTRRAFVYNLSRASFHKEWNGNYREPGAGSKILAFLIRILPKVGPFKALSFKAPTQQTENLFETSFDRTMAEYRRLLTAEGEGHLTLVNRDLDTGEPTRPGEYMLANKTYGWLAQETAAQEPAAQHPDVVKNVVGFYQGVTQQLPGTGKTKDWQKTMAAVQKLRSEQAKPQ
jgi:hypothetical protein